MFNPIVPPPSEHHQFATGHGTEFGDTAKAAMEKVNAGFKHVYAVLKGMGATLADEVEYVAKAEFDALVHELDETKAELANIKMMVQGLGFAGARPEPKFRRIVDPGGTHPIALMTGPPVGTIVVSDPVPVLVVGNVDGAKSDEPKVTEL